MANYLFNFTKKGAAKGRTLRDQAAELLNVGLWGIGDRTANRDALAPGDEVLIYVGAPESSFIADARLSQGTHDWDPDEARRYPGSFTAGVSFEATNLWAHPLRIAEVLGSLSIQETNPRARFFGGIVRITPSDFNTVRTAAQQSAPSPTPVTTTSAPQVSSAAAPRSGTDSFFDVTERLKELLTGSRAQLSEYDTRALLIDRYLDALGYTGLDDVHRGSPVESGNFPDYVINIGGNPAIALEAKRLGSRLGPKDAAQAVAYCSNLGVRWGAVTDGQYFHLYDAPVLGIPPVDRVVLSVDLADYVDRDDFEARIYPRMSLLEKHELESGMGLQRWVAREAAREFLTTSTSRTIRALRKELDDVKHIRLSAADVDQLIAELLG